MDKEKKTEKSDNFQEETKSSLESQELNHKDVEKNSQMINKKKENSMTERATDNSSEHTKELNNLHGAVALTIIPEKSLNEQQTEDKNNILSRPVSAESITSSSLSLSSEVAYTELKEEHEEQNLTTHESTALFQTCIPYLPLEIAIVCLIFNILLPGFGSVICGISNFCCGKMQETVKKEDVPIKVFINLLVGFMQLLTVTFLLVGWFWSMAWGIKILLLSIENRKKMKQQKMLKAKKEGIKFAFTYADNDTADAGYLDDNDDKPNLRY